MKETAGRFQWISSNVSYADGKPLPGVLPHVVLKVRDEVVMKHPSASSA